LSNTTLHTGLFNKEHRSLEYCCCNFSGYV